MYYVSIKNNKKYPQKRHTNTTCISPLGNRAHQYFLFESIPFIYRQSMRILIISVINFYLYAYISKKENCDRHLKKPDTGIIAYCYYYWCYVDT